MAGKRAPRPPDDTLVLGKIGNLDAFIEWAASATIEELDRWRREHDRSTPPPSPRTNIPPPPQRLNGEPWQHCRACGHWHFQGRTCVVEHESPPPPTSQPSRR